MASDLQDLLQELDARIRGLEALPEEVQEQVFTMLQVIDSVHRTSVSRLAAQLKEAGIWERALEDDGVNVLFTLYDQLPLVEEAQVEDALELVRPYIHSHGGEVEVLKVEDGVVHLMLKGSCQSCSASSDTLKRGVETALREGFAGFKGVVVHEADEPPHEGWIDLPMVTNAASRTKPQGPVFRQVARLSDLPTDRAAVVSVEGRSVLLVRSGAQAYAYDPACPGCTMSLEGAKLSGNVLVCPWQNCAYDVRSGRRADGEAGENLRVYPVSVQADQVLLAMEFAPAALFGAGG
jgi:Fe-S cluster biogenesis protein NfuA/nitrite reductase/ring-hydroxylating ferredoxin subunit